MNKLFTSLCLFALMLLGTISTTFAQSSDPYWARFKHKESKGLIQDANAVLDTLESMALRKHDTLQLFRVHFERAVLLNSYGQNHEKDAIFFTDSVMRSSAAPYRNLYEKMLCQYLYQYYELNREPLFNREVSSDTTLANLDQWNLDILRNAILQHQQASQSNAEILKNYPLEDFLFFYQDSLPAYKYDHTTLYDFVFGKQVDTNSTYEKAVRYYEMAMKSDKNNDWLVEAHKLFTELLESPKILERHNAKAYLQAIEQQYVRTVQEIPNLLYTTGKLLIPIEYANIDTLYVTCLKDTWNEVWRFSLSFTWREVRYMLKHPDFNFNYMSWLDSPYFDSLRTECFVLPNKQDYYAQSTDLFLDSLPNGNYLIVFHNRPVMDINSLLHGLEISICDKNIVLEGRFGNRKHYRVVNATTGEPAPDVKVVASHKNMGRPKHSDADGLITLPYREWDLSIQESKNSLIWSYTDWSATPGSDFGFLYRIIRKCEECTFFRRYERRLQRSLLITDRTAYRPGQKVYFKAVCFKQRKEQVVANQPVDVYLKKGFEWKNIDSLHLFTNTFGSADSCFVLPENLEPGNYLLTFTQKHPHRSTNCNFKVEEYKRPTFEVKMDTIKDAYAMGDTVNLWGRALYYSGMPVPGATAKVSISVLNAEWTATTDPAGYFHVAIPTALFPEGTYANERQKVVTQINVTAPDGEIQITQKTFSIAGNRLKLKLHNTVEHINTQMDRQMQVSISLKNQDNAVISDIFHIAVYRLDMPVQQRFQFTHPKPSMPLYSDAEYQRYFPTYSFEESECQRDKFKSLSTVLEKTTTDTVVKLRVQDWETGIYKMVVQTSDFSGERAQDSTFFSIVGKGPFRQTDNIYAAILDNLDSAFKANGVLHYAIGSSTIPNAQVYYHISYDGKTVKQGHCVLSDTLLTDSVAIKIPSKAVKGTAQIVAYTFYHNHLYPMEDIKDGLYDKAILKSWEKNLQAPLQIQVEHLNDKLVPGTSETWSFTLKGSDSTQHPESEILAMLYDASLDVFTAFDQRYDRDFSKWNDSHSSVLNNAKYRKYRSLYYFRKPKVFFAPELFSYGSAMRRKTKPLPVLSLRDGQLPSVRSFTTGFYEQNITADKYSSSIIKGRVTDQTGEPLAWSSLILKTMDNRTVNMAMSDENGNYSLYNVPIGLFSLTADAQMTCKKSQTKTNIEISRYHTVQFIDFVIDCSSNLEEVVITYVPPMFEPDYTSSSVRGNRADRVRVIDDGVLVRSASDPNVTEALSGAKGVGSRDGEITSVRGAFSPQTESSESEILQQARQELLGSIQPRTNFAETAFFLPHLRTDEQGRISFQFTAPDQLTRWHFAAIAHTKDHHITTCMQDVTTRRALMVMPNVPRFVREGDTLLFQSTILAMEQRPLHGDARLEMWDTLSQQPLTIANADQPFRCDSAGRALSAWTVTVPHHIRNLQYKLAAVGTMPGYTFSDAETRNIPVLPQAIELHESLPFHIVRDSSRRITTTFTASGTRILHISTHPTWAIYQTLPYIINSRHDCNNELMYKYFANNLAKHYLEQHPLLLQKSELDTPMRTLFNADRLQKDLLRLSRKLQLRQNIHGGWGWFDGNYADNYITTRILTHIGQLDRLGITHSLEPNGKNALRYLCKQEQEEYELFLADTTPDKQFNFGTIRIQFLYALSYYADWQEDWLPQSQMDFYLDQAEQHYVQSNLCEKAMLAIVCHRLGRAVTALQWAEALRQQGHRDEYGLSWTELRSRQRGWHDVAVNAETLLMELFEEVLPDTTDTQRAIKAQTLVGITQWLLAQRTTNHWDCSATSTAVCYAIALQEKNEETASNKSVKDILIRVGDTLIRHPDTLLCGTYALPDNGNNAVRIENHSGDAVYGSVWLQYEQALDSVRAFGSGELSMQRTLHRRNFQGVQGEWETIAAGDTLRVGDILAVRFVIQNARNLDYVNLSDMRACALEPVVQTSQWNGNGDLRWYESPRDNTTEFYITHLDRGTHMLEYRLKVTQAGVFRSGMATLESMLAPEFTAHSDSPKMRVER